MGTLCNNVGTFLGASTAWLIAYRLQRKRFGAVFVEKTETCLCSVHFFFFVSRHAFEVIKPK